MFGSGAFQRRLFGESPEHARSLQLSAHSLARTRPLPELDSNGYLCYYATDDSNSTQTPEAHKRINLRTGCELGEIGREDKFCFSITEADGKLLTLGFDGREQCFEW